MQELEVDAGHAPHGAGGGRRDFGQTWVADPREQDRGGFWRRPGRTHSDGKAPAQEDAAKVCERQLKRLRQLI